MKLGPKFTNELLRALHNDAKRPALTDEPDLEPGEAIELRRNRVWIIPLKLKKKGWVYMVRDFRVNTLHMSATLSVPGDEFSTIVTRSSTHREREPEAVHTREADSPANPAKGGDTLAQREQRAREETLRMEARLNRARKQGKTGTVRTLEKRLQRKEAA